MNFTKNLFNKRNLYFAGIIVVLLLTVGGIWQYRNYMNEKRAQIQYEEEMMDFTKEDEQLLQQEQQQSDVGLQIIQEEEKQSENPNTAKEVAKIETSKPTSTKKITETTIPAMKMEQPNMQTMISPVFGTVSMDYSNEKLLYSKTLELWSTHFGLDIKSDEGTSVRAAMDGVIAEVADDAQWGLSITINHGSGIKTKYCNLSTLDMVKVGQKIVKGDVISGVGKTALCEIADDPHIHFEVLKDGKNLDPKTYLPKQSLKR